MGHLQCCAREALTLPSLATLTKQKSCLGQAFRVLPPLDKGLAAGLPKRAADMQRVCAA